MLEQALACHGVGFRDLRRDAEAVALFGSRAAGCATSHSDWDVLCVGEGQSLKLPGLDLVWVARQSLATSAWLGGDLAGHVAAYALWVEGGPSWDLGAVDFRAAARRKEARLVRGLEALAAGWELLGPAYRVKRATLLRRDAQRLRLLQIGVPIPPSPVLDERWAADTSHGWLTATLEGLGASRDLARAVRVYAASGAPRQLRA